MKFLIVGGNGFIGSHLVDRLSEQKHDVIVLDLNERQYDLMPKGIKFIQGNLIPKESTT